MTLSEIQTVIRQCTEKLESLNSDPTFRDIQDSEEFTTPNDLLLSDAIQALYEVEGAITSIN